MGCGPAESSDDKVTTIVNKPKDEKKEDTKPANKEPATAPKGKSLFDPTLTADEYFNATMEKLFETLGLDKSSSTPLSKLKERFRTYGAPEAAADLAFDDSYSRFETLNAETHIFSRWGAFLLLPKEKGKFISKETFLKFVKNCARLYDESLPKQTDDEIVKRFIEKDEDKDGVLNIAEFHNALT